MKKLCVLIPILYIVCIVLNIYSQHNIKMNFITVPVARGTVTDKFINQETMFLTVNSKNVEVSSDTYTSTHINDNVNLIRHERVYDVYTYIFVITTLILVIVFVLFLSF